MKDLTTFYLLIINIVSFIMMYIDKVKAIKHEWRISENTLMTLCAIGGSIGTILSMKLFRHKTKHPKFYIGAPLLLILQLIICFYIYFEI
ncbi:MAG: DUF1294 domain-containing protein [Sarcina sp.]